MNIKPTDLVLEIGSGNNPNPRSDVLCDLFVSDNSQRAGNFSIIIDRPFIVSDCYKLPFKDNSFDYIICSHLLEHLDDPEKFIKELTRVGKAGYIEVPNIYGERLFGWDFHLWYCEFKKGTLILTRKKEGERFGGFYHRLIAKNIWFRRFFEENEDMFYIKYEWDNKIKIQIKEKNNKENHIEEIDKEVWNLMRNIKWNIKKDYIFYLQWMRKRILRKLNKITRRYAWNFKKIYKKNKPINDLLQILVCLNCKNNLALSKSYLFCKNCNFRYKLNGGIPIMLNKNK